jgi:carbonic anhydrase
MSEETDMADQASTETPSAAAPAAEPEVKSFLERAQQAVESAVETTLGAVKEHPATAAAIAAGATAAVAGAAYGISKLLGDDDKKA